MKNPLRSLLTLSRRTAITLVLLLLVVGLGILAAIQIPALGEEGIKTILARAGFNDAKIENVSLYPNGISAREIRLDTYGFDTIDDIHVVISWPAFLLKGEIKSVEISGMKLSRDVKQSKALFQNTFVNLGKLSGYRMIINKAQLDMITPFGDLRFSGNATIDPPDTKGVQTIGAHIVADQYQLSFDSKWQGKIDKDANLMMSADFVDGRLHFGPMNVTRFHGWIGAEMQKGVASFQTQFAAGGADLFKVPLQNISLAADVSGDTSTLIYRSAMAGRPDVLLSVDMMGEKENTTFDMLLKGNDLSAFFNDIAGKVMQGRAVPGAINIPEGFALSSSYQQDRRFEGGPLPFSLDFKAGSKSILNGNYLIYVDELDIRGSAEGTDDTAKALQDYLRIGGTHVEGNLIRLDGDLESLFGEESTTCEVALTDKRRNQIPLWRTTSPPPPR